jgi:hypothetical protein
VTDIATSPPALALAPRFSIGRTLSLSFAVLWRNLWRMFAIGLAVMLLQMAIEEYVVLAAADLLGAGISILGALVLIALVNASVTVGTLQHLRGERPTLAGMLRGGLRRIGRALIGAVLWVIAILLPSVAALAAGIWIGLPALLLIGGACVFGLSVLVVWFVLIPVMVAEDMRILSSFGRSRQLTSGHRWGVLGVALILAAILATIMMLGVALDYATYYALLTFAPLQATMLPWLSLVAVPFGAFSSLMTAIIPAVTYHFLQAEKEGGGTDVLARVFD